MTATRAHQTEQAWLAAIIESSEDAIIAKDLNGIVTGWNGAAERLFGYAVDEMLGRPLTIIFPANRADEEAMILGRIARGERIDHYETERQHKDGRIFPVSVTVSPIKDETGAIVGASNITRDLSERDAHERRVRELQAELAHVQRLTELGLFVSALVHEVNQPLTAISNYVNACRRLINAGNISGVVGAVERIGEQTLRTRETVRRIRDFLKKKEVVVQTEHLATLIHETIDLTQNTARGEEVRIETDVPPSMRVSIDRVQVQQVVFNLLRNAIEATRGQPGREINVAARPSTEGMVELRVADSGPGLPDEVQQRLFEPFFTTKPNGMGIGLSVCRTIIEAHGGSLWAENSAQGGAVFRLTLRMSDEQPMPAQAPP